MERYYNTTKEERRKLATRQAIPFKNKILILGCGGVAQCVLPLIPRLINVDLSNITVVDMVDNSHKIKEFVDNGVKFVTAKLNKENLTSTIESYIEDGGFLVDLAYEIDTLELLEFCRRKNLKYINASVEVWDPYHDVENKKPQELTLYWRHMRLRKALKAWGDTDGPTAIIDHGANPGLVSHFVKLALQDIAKKIIAEKPDEDPERTKILKKALEENDFPTLAMTEGVKVIHISERDTQISNKPKEVNEFVNTWSPEGLYEEGVAPAELGWGTHERQLPPHGLEHEEGPRNQICLARKGIDCRVRSWVPTPNDNGDILGMVIRHGEVFTISNHLTVWEGNAAKYRPTVHYAYCASNDALVSLEELRMRHFQMHPRTRVLNDEIVSGEDLLGCLLMGHDFKAWWIGSMLDINEARELVPHQNATTLQVAIALVSAMQWAIRNPRRGILVPDDLPHEEILRECFPFLGPFKSMAVDWSPIDGIKSENRFRYRKKPIPSKEDEWQFSSFLFEL